MKNFSTLFVFAVFFSVLSTTAVAFPVFKIEKELFIEIDSIKETKSELHIYSYPMINAYGFSGVYTELFVYNFEDILLSYTQKSMTVPYLGYEESYLIKQKKTSYDFKGNKTEIIKTVNMSDNVIFKKEKKVLISEDGHRTKRNDIYEAKNLQNGYRKPSKLKLFFHNHSL